MGKSTTVRVILLLLHYVSLGNVYLSQLFSHALYTNFIPSLVRSVAIVHDMTLKCSVPHSRERLLIQWPSLTSFTRS